MRAIIFLFISTVFGQAASRYADLGRTINRNTGFAHATRGVNRYTLTRCTVTSPRIRGCK